MPLGFSDEIQNLSPFIARNRDARQFVDKYGRIWSAIPVQKVGT